MKSSLVIGTIALVVGLGVGLVLAGRTDVVRADGGGDANRDLIAVTGSVGSGTSVLWLIDTDSRRLSVYKSDLGKNVVWVAARDITYDFKVEEFHDESEYSVSRLKKVWADWDKRRASDGDPARGRGGRSDDRARREEDDK